MAISRSTEQSFNVVLLRRYFPDRCAKESSRVSPRSSRTFLRALLASKSPKFRSIPLNSNVDIAVYDDEIFHRPVLETVFHLLHFLHCCSSRIPTLNALVAFVLHSSPSSHINTKNPSLHRLSTSKQPTPNSLTSIPQNPSPPPPNSTQLA